MGKLFVTNMELTVKDKDELRGTIFKKSSDYNSTGFSFFSCYKLNVENENTVFFNENDFITFSGTIFYKSCIGVEALEAIFHDFEGSVTNIRKNIFGNYFIFISKNESKVIFGDENSIYDIYYHISEGESWSISSLLSDIIKVSTHEFSIHRNNLLETVFQNGIIDDGSIYNEIDRLNGQQYLAVDSLGTVKLHNLVSNNHELITEPYEELVSSLRNTSKMISTNYNNIAISMTGGLDSRLALSMLVSSGTKPHLYYGVGNNFITNTKTEDLNLVKFISEHLNLSLELKNWNTSRKIDGNWSDLSTKYGVFGGIYGGSEGFFRSYEKSNADYIEYGYFGETLRNSEWLDNVIDESFTLEYFLTDFYINPHLKSILSAAEEACFFEHILIKYTKICEENNLNKFSININEFQILHSYYRIAADRKIVNFTNLFTNSTAQLASKHNLSIISKFSIEQKKHSRIMLRLISDLLPESLEVPIYSHIRKYKYDNNLDKLLPVNSFGENVVRLAKKYLKVLIKQPQIKNLFRATFVRMNSSQYSEKEKAEILNMNSLRVFCLDYLCSKSDIKWDLKKFSGDYRHLLSLTYLHYFYSTYDKKKK